MKDKGQKIDKTIGKIECSIDERENKYKDNRNLQKEQGQNEPDEYLAKISEQYIQVLKLVLKSQMKLKETRFWLWNGICGLHC